MTIPTDLSALLADLASAERACTDWAHRFNAAKAEHEPDDRRWQYDFDEEWSGLYHDHDAAMSALVRYALDMNDAQQGSQERSAATTPSEKL